MLLYQNKRLMDVKAAAKLATVIPIHASSVGKPTVPIAHAGLGIIRATLLIDIFAPETPVAVPMAASSNLTLSL